MKPRQNEVHAFSLRGSLATHALVLSENDWNDWADDCVIVPIYPAAGLGAPNLLRVATRWGTADCSRTLSVRNDDLGDLVDTPPPTTLTATRVGVRAFLCVDDLLAHRVAAAPPTGRWYPRWTCIYYRRTPVRGERKMHAILSDDDWNRQMAWVSAARLTSKSKQSRIRWEAQVTGGPAVVGDLHLLAIGDVIPDPPRPPRPHALTPAEMDDMANALVRLLSL